MTLGPEAGGMHAPRETDDPLNESCSASFEVDGYVSFHFTPRPMPTNMRDWMRHMTKFRDGLKKLAQKLDGNSVGKFTDKYAAAKYVVVTSWIVAERSKILTGHGIDEEFPSEENTVKQQLFDVYRGRQEQDEVPEQYRGPNGPIAAFRKEKGAFIEYWRTRS